MLKKNEEIELEIEGLEFPNKGFAFVDEDKVTVKNTIPGQTVRVSIRKKKGNYEGNLKEIIKKALYEIQPLCDCFATCGGCTYQQLAYDTELELKQNMVLDLLKEADIQGYEFLGIVGSPLTEGYRNKMEFSFGDTGKDGELSLGMRKRNSYYEVVNAGACNIVDEDVRQILREVLSFFKANDEKFYNRTRNTGYLRHLVVRKAYFTGQILINLITVSEHTDKRYTLDPLVDSLLQLTLDGAIVSILHTINTSLADVVKADQMHVLHGTDYFYEKLFDLQFKISPFSFFQTNSVGAQTLYTSVKSLLGDCRDKIIFDLYCGTGTIAQIVSAHAKKVIGVEIVEEAIDAAIENATINHITNCEFIAGDVLHVVAEITEKPDIIILDPPREGIHPKAIYKIIAFGAEKIVYVSCKPTSLVRDLAVFQAEGYVLEKLGCVDMFPRTGHVETIVLLQRQTI